MNEILNFLNRKSNGNVRYTMIHVLRLADRFHESSMVYVVNKHERMADGKTVSSMVCEFRTVKKTMAYLRGHLA